MALSVVALILTLVLMARLGAVSANLLGEPLRRAVVRFDPDG